jgi:hypothetical protein
MVQGEARLPPIPEGASTSESTGKTFSELGQHEIEQLIRLNKRLNQKALNRKVFCVGLHKQGTTTLAALAKLYGYTSTHSTDWCWNQEKLNRFNFFSDGGSHYDDIHEFDFPGLDQSFPDSLFIMQVRDPLKWITSKLKHAGWDATTKAIAGDPEKPPSHSLWKEKSLLNIERFLKHKYNYENKVKRYFQNQGPARLLVIDFTDQTTHDQTLTAFEDFLGVKSITQIRIPHKNKSTFHARGTIAADAHAYAKQKVIEIFNSSTNLTP